MNLCGFLDGFVRVGYEIIWADRPEDLAAHTAPDENGNQAPIPPKSLTFIPAKVTENRALMAADPATLPI
ncbi:hypothetical protein [Bradyrhizobium sp. STM 3557]|uniref:hypothetical protein n=1 Tax=Bradyrhizobium sp. STM 3557 TaxID=578920 RepID=UPI0038903CD4